MDVTGKGTSWQKLTNVSKEHRQKMFDNVTRESVEATLVQNVNRLVRNSIDVSV